MDAFLALDELNRRTLRCAPYPERWKRFANAHSLAWQSITFTKANRRNVPNEPGIYCFVVGHTFISLPPVGYPLYVGVVGTSKKSRDRTLRERFGEYTREKDNPRGRLHVRNFLRAFDGELTFFCAPWHVKPADLLKTEKLLNDALMPPYSVKDFTATTRAQRNAWQ
jgi:hypothetical protein